MAVLLLQLMVVVGMLALLVWGLTQVGGRPSLERRHRPAVTHGRWRVGHYDAGDATRVVLQRVVDGGSEVLDEHVVATIDADDPQYDERFMTAMQTARERQALFEAEEG